MNCAISEVFGLSFGHVSKSHVFFVLFIQTFIFFLGFDCIEYRQTEAMDSFQLGAGATVNVGQPTCMESYLIIPTPVIPAVSPDAAVQAAMAQSNTRYCGNALGPIDGFAAGTVRSKWFLYS